MHFSSVNSVQRIKLIIPSGCEPGSVCGVSELFGAMHLKSPMMVHDNAYIPILAHFKKSPAGTAGSLTLLPDDTLYRFLDPFFTTTGTLSQLPNADN
jgi:hypothetical protein